MTKRIWQVSAVLGLFLMSMAGWAGASSQPPPAQGPPVAAPDAPGAFFITFFRRALEDQGNEIFAKNNDCEDADGLVIPGCSKNPHKLSWASGARPTECGYDCVGPPSRTVTRHVNRPNERIVRLSSRLEFHLDVNNSPFSRRIITNVDLIASCRGWREGDGRVALRVASQPPFIEGGGGFGSFFENVLDFFSAGALSSFIDAKIRAKLGMGETTSEQLPFRCRSLGAFNNFSSGNFSFDAVIWDFPEPPSPIIVFGAGEALSGAVVVTLERIRRKKTLSAVDVATPVGFEFYVNGAFVAVPGTDSLVIPVDGERDLGDVQVRLPLGSLESLQLLVADSLGGAGWSQFDSSTNFGKGSHVLRTHRTELIPVGSLPGVSILQPPPALPGLGMPADLQLRFGPLGGPPGSNKPTPIDVRDFEIEYSISVFRPEIFAPVVGGASG